MMQATPEMSPSGRITRAQHRQMLRESNAHRYRLAEQGKRLSVENIEGTDGALMRAAVAKRERKAAKRVRDAQRTALGLMIGREVMEGINFHANALIASGFPKPTRPFLRLRVSAAPAIKVEVAR
jgi:hypothetical protein